MLNSSVYPRFGLILNRNCFGLNWTANIITIENLVMQSDYCVINICFTHYFICIDQTKIIIQILESCFVTYCVTNLFRRIFFRKVTWRPKTNPLDFTELNHTGL